jgi:penicillin amidase
MSLDRPAGDRVLSSHDRAARLRAAVPDVTRPVAVPALAARAEVWRDREGVPHVRAASLRNAFVAQGFVHAQDRLWHMEYDRRRAAGRWAEYVGASGVPDDALMRRLRLAACARSEYDALNGETRAMLDAYAAGVNAFIQTQGADHQLPIEFQLLEARPEPWEPWQSLAVFKVRHAMMGTWQLKAWRAQLVRHLGVDRAARLCPGTPANPVLIVPPGLAADGPAFDMLGDLAQDSVVPASLIDWETGSNNWAVAGHRTASGKPLVAGDPHRPLDVPNVYYQNHVACPELDAIGFSFPGVPGFPHFGHTQSVAWCVTHAQADYQDLYVERFHPDDARRYEYRGEWHEAATSRETIRVRNGEPVTIDVTVTRHGPIVLGDPRRGHAVAIRYTGTEAPNATAETLLPMLRARSADEFETAARRWVDPVQNLVFADNRGASGAIGYRTRGHVPVRARANAWLPVPGWDGRHEWEGTVAFEAMPALRDPPEGLIVTANSRIVGAEYPHHLGLDYGADFRTRRLWERLLPLARATAADMAAIHADRVSIAARELVASLDGLAEALRQATAPDPAVSGALGELLAWDAEMDAERVAPTIYAAFRERLLRELMAPLLGPLAAEAFAGAPRGAVGHMARLRSLLAGWIRQDDRAFLPPGMNWPAMLARALTGAVAELGRLAPREDGRRWGQLHATGPRHPLSAMFPDWADVLDPPSVSMGGDGDTVQQAGFFGGAGYGVTVLSVSRYVFDLGDWDRSGWIVPLGASGHAGSPHYGDQLPTWSATRLVPMRYDWTRIREEAATHQTLEPTPGASPA